MQNIILGIACTNTTEQAKIVLIDPKLGVDYFAFDGLPHLQGGIIEDQQAAILMLNELVGQMNHRYAVLKENKVSNIFDLNKKPDATAHLPLLWIIHDEFAEWMMSELCSRQRAPCDDGLLSEIDDIGRALLVAGLWTGSHPSTSATELCSPPDPHCWGWSR